MEFNNELARVAERYRSEGYEVAMHPQRALLPAFAAQFQPDMLATKDDLSVVVQVKEDQEDLRKDPDLSRMADVINAQPGWRFDLVVLNRDGDSERIAKDAAEPSIEALSQNLDRAERAAEKGDTATAFILAWAALEAAMRRAARTAGLEVERLSPLFLLGTLYSNGLLERHEYDELNNYLRLRNAAVHGLEVPPFDVTAPAYVTTVARKLLAFDGKELPA